MIDPLNIEVNLAGVETDLPLLPDGEYLFQISESSLEPNKDKNGYNWKKKLSLVNPATAVDGRTVSPNFPVFSLSACQAKADSKDPDAFKRTLGENIDAIFGTTKDNRPPLNMKLVQDAVGKMVIAKIKIDEYEGKKSNKVQRLKAATSA